jgi:TRAP-type mannitol/chloroaromatic compound transport system permease small subunit
MGLVEAWGANPVGWFFAHLIEAPWNLVVALSQPGTWLNWADPEALMRFIYFGASAELFFLFLLIFFLLTALGLARPAAMWAMIRASEAFQNATGRLFAWVGLIMVIQQIVIIFMQRVFGASQISLGFGKVVTFDISWWSEELKLYNAMIVCLCIAYTFVQGGHVRVDLFYAPARFRTKKLLDMFGALFFMLPAATLIWLYSWFFLWRNLITPATNAGDDFDRFMQKARAVRWNVETIGFSPNGFNAYFLFKVLLIVLTAFMFLMAVTMFWRSLQEWREGEAAEGKHIDRDPPADAAAEFAATK